MGAAVERRDWEDWEMEGVNCVGCVGGVAIKRYTRPAMARTPTEATMSPPSECGEVGRDMTDGYQSQAAGEVELTRSVGKAGNGDVNRMSGCRRAVVEW